MNKSVAFSSLVLAVLMAVLTVSLAGGSNPVAAQGRSDNSNQGPPTYYIVQFSGPVQQDWKDQVTAEGAELLAYLPDFAFKARMNPAQARNVETVENVSAVTRFTPGLKLSPNLIREGTNLYTVRIERGADAGLARAAIARTGAEVVSRQGNILLVAANGDQLGPIAEVLDVAWVENFMLKEKHNEYGAGVIMGANVSNTTGYDGSTQTVAVADTGLGGGTATTAHQDIPGSRVTAIFDWPGQSNNCYKPIGDGARDVDSGHGTHVATSILGDGGVSGEGKGTAPAASLVFQAVENWTDMKGLCALTYPDGYYLIGIPEDLHDLFQQAYGSGARIHSNSWGSDANGDYTLDSANADDFIWNNPDMTITFSAGNSGIDANGDGVIDSGSTGSPATAKNVISVGASENDRQGDYSCDTGLTYTSCSGQNDIFTYGSAWPLDYPSNPIASDPSAGNPEQMAAFSSRGPTNDGRIKPDVVAPGTWVLSGYSDLYQQGYDTSANPQDNAWQYDGWGYPANQQYKYMGGTSMANPLTAGGAAVVRDYYQKAYSHNASAALVKATLINSAVDMLDENNDGANDNDYPIPNDHEGWGRVDLANATDGSEQFIDDALGLGTGGNTSYTVATTGSSPLKVSLVWSDYPSTETAATNLVNDLDLVVTAPGGTVYRGNSFSGGWSQSGGSADHVNNVENVYLQSAGAGDWTVEISGFNVPMGPQPFALVVDGGSFSAPPVANAGSDQTLSDGDNDGMVSVTLDGSGSYDASGGVLAYEWAEGATVLGTGQVVTMAFGVGTHPVTLTVTDYEGLTDTDDVMVTVNANQAPTANAGPDQSVSDNNGFATVTLDGSGSSDPDGSIVAYQWMEGSTVLGNGASISSSLSTGQHTIALMVTDNGGATSTDDVVVTVTSTPPGATQVTVVSPSGTQGYSTSGGKDGDKHLTVTVTLQDDLDGMVSGASVSVDVTNGSSTWSASGTSGADGSVAFSITNAPSGCYTTDVTALNAGGLTWVGGTPANAFGLRASCPSP